MKYEDLMEQKITALYHKSDAVILAIESSCDETACSITRGFEVLSSVIASQIDVHKLYGGVVPEIASRNHTVNIKGVVDEAVKRAGVKLEDIDAVAVTYGAGLLGALLIGVSYAKALAYALSKPLIAVNHIRGHISAGYLTHKDLVPPYICLVASGGHTAICAVKTYNDITVLGQTQDDAAGEAFDKVARVLGLNYPGGPLIDKLAAKGKNTIPMPHPYKGESHYNMSYSGLKTAVINYVHNASQKGENICSEDLAASFQCAAIDMPVDNAIRAAITYGFDKISVAGGVGANSYLRNTLIEKAQKHGIKIFLPELKYCTDNAAMIASCAFVQLMEGIAHAAPLTLDATATLKITD